MRSIGILLAIAAVLAPGVPRAASADKRVAVLPLNVTRSAKSRLDADGARAMTEVLRDAAVNFLPSTGWLVLSTETTLQLLNERGVDPAKFDDADCTLAFARQMKVEMFVTGSVEWSDAQFVGSVRLFDTSSGKMVAARATSRKTSQCISLVKGS